MRTYIYFSTPKGFLWWPLSYLIRYLESNERPKLWHSSHVAIRLGDNMYEAVLFLGVRKISLYKWLEKNNVSLRLSLDIPHQKQQKYVAFLEGSIGVPYAPMELIGILYSRFMKRFFNKDVKNPFTRIKRKVKCTEFALEGINNFIEKKDTGDINNVGVRKLEGIVKENQYGEEV